MIPEVSRTLCSKNNTYALKYHGIIKQCTEQHSKLTIHQERPEENTAFNGV